MEHTKKKILLCTFTTKVAIQETVKSINDTYEVVNNKIIILYDTDDVDRLFCIYNVLGGSQITKLPKTILLHRKKETNTLYTINSLNKLVLRLNGSYDIAYRVNWKDFKNVLLLLRNDELLTISTDLLVVHNTNEPVIIGD